MALIDVETIGFARAGADIRIFQLTRITSPDRISIGSHVVVDDFVFLQGGAGLAIGSYVHIASFASVTGGGEGVIRSFANISSGGSRTNRDRSSTAPDFWVRPSLSTCAP